MQLVDRELFTNRQLEWDLSTASAAQREKEYLYGRTENIPFFFWEMCCIFENFCIYSYIIFSIDWDPVLTIHAT